MTVPSIPPPPAKPPRAVRAAALQDKAGRQSLTLLLLAIPWIALYLADHHDRLAVDVDGVLGALMSLQLVLIVVTKVRIVLLRR